MIQSMQNSPTTFAAAAEKLAKGGEGSYQSICKPALMSCLVGLFSIGALLSASLIVLPILGVVLFVFALRSFRLYPHELVGRKLMLVGGVLNLVLLGSSIAWHTYCYNTEVPPNYERILFSFLRPDEETKTVYSQKAVELDGKRVFIKGYVLPSERAKNMKDFILVGDFGDCCFGGSPQITHLIAVSFQTDDRIDYSWRKRHIGGTFHLNKESKRTSVKEVPRALYSIEADYLK